MLEGNLARLLFRCVESIENLLEEVVQDDLPTVNKILGQIVVSCFSSSSEGRQLQDRQTAGVVERARHYVDRNLASARLTPEALCHHLGISRTRAYHLFEGSGGLLHFIKKRRLMAAHNMLSDPSNDQRILEIGAATGFDTPANFSRAFRAEFGYTPREVREHALFWWGTSGRAAGSDESFRTWLQTLGR